MRPHRNCRKNNMRLAWLLVAVCLIGCDSSKEPAPHRAGQQSYFPLNEGARWTYQVTNEADGKTTQTSQQIRILPAKQYEGRTIHVRRSERDANIGVEYWLESDASGVNRIALRTDSQQEPVLDTVPRTVLKLPLVEGDMWKAPTVAYGVLRNVDFPRKVKEAVGTIMTFTVENINQKVTVPAGSFERCARIKGRAQVTLDMGRVRVRADDTLYTDAMERMRRVPLVQTEWYCPGVGLVKLERLEAITLNFSNAERILLELSDYNID
jgi:hypothetical protein